MFECPLIFNCGLSSPPEILSSPYAVPFELFNVCCRITRCRIGRRWWLLVLWIHDSRCVDIVDVTHGQTPYENHQTEDFYQFQQHLACIYFLVFVRLL